MLVLGDGQCIQSRVRFFLQCNVCDGVCIPRCKKEYQFLMSPF